MDVLQITGGRPLRGAVAAAGSKNASLPIMAASILADEPIVLEHVPNLADVDTMSFLLGHLGVEVKRRPDGTLLLTTLDRTPVTADADLVGRMRASFCVLGPLLAHRRKAIVALPGGCRIGDRPVDLHLKGLASLGADIRTENGYVIAHATALHGAKIDLAGPRGPTVTGTANVLMAAALARGETIIRGAACEPEILDLGSFLISLGARIEGLGTSTLRILGVAQLGGATHRIIPDRIEIGTLLVAGAMTQGDLTVTGCQHSHLNAVVELLDQAGVALTTAADSIRVRAPTWLRPIHFAAVPYPGVPTDLQAQFMALAAIAEGRSTIGDYVFPRRFGHVDELRRFGAQIELRGSTATIDGVNRLRAATVRASDLRASAALILAALATADHSIVRHVRHLDRGYECLDAKLRCLGATIRRNEFADHHPAPDQRRPESNRLGSTPARHLTQVR